MTVKPLSENDLVAMCDDQFMTPGAGRCTEHPTVISYERLKELFAFVDKILADESRSIILSGQTNRMNAVESARDIAKAQALDFYRAVIRKAFGPLVPK